MPFGAKIAFFYRMRLPRIVIYSLLTLIVAGGAWYYVFVFKAPRKLAAPPKLETVLPKNMLAAMNGRGAGQTRIAAAKPGDKPVAAPAATPAATDSPLPKFTGNGMNQFSVTVKNTTKRPIKFVLKAGEIYENSKNRVVLLEGCDRQVPSGSTLQIDLRAAALSSGNTSGDEPYAKSSATVPQLDALLQKAQNRPEITHEALQTAILALAENPVLDVFAKFPRLHDAPAAGNSNFKVDTVDIIGAMQLLSDIGVVDRLAASDPQLEIEAMIDPKAHDAATRYYGITPEMEWTYWKHELLQGNPSTRHYALYGIARYYPDVALVMLPKWAKESRLKPIYRLSAVRALAVTNRQEAIEILHQLESQFNADPDLHQSADRAVKYLSIHFNQPS